MHKKIDYFKDNNALRLVRLEHVHRELLKGDQAQLRTKVYLAFMRTQI